MESADQIALGIAVERAVFTRFVPVYRVIQELMAHRSNDINSCLVHSTEHVELAIELDRSMKIDLLRVWRGTNGQ